MFVYFHFHFYQYPNLVELVVELVVDWLMVGATAIGTHSHYKQL